MSSESVHALVLRSFEFGESSQILHLFTREQGLIHGIAKGARRPKSAFRGGADLLTEGEVTVYARRGSAELHTLGSFDVTHAFPGIRERLPRFHAAHRIAAFVLAFAREEQPSPELWDLATAGLRVLESSDDGTAEATALCVEAMGLNLMGFAPILDRCASCGRAARNVSTARLSPANGGLLCSACRSADARSAELSGPALEALRVLAVGPLLDAPSAAAEPGIRVEIAEALDAWTTHLLDRPMLRGPRFR